LLAIFGELLIGPDVLANKVNIDCIWGGKSLLLAAFRLFVKGSCVAVDLRQAGKIQKGLCVSRDRISRKVNASIVSVSRFLRLHISSHQVR
jgi:hypothetical protein